MAYISDQDIINRVGNDAALRLTTDSGSLVSLAVLDEVRLSAEGEVNGHLSKRYSVPVDLTAHPDVAATLKGFALDVAVYRLHARRPPVPEAVKEARDNAIGWFAAIRDGKMNLPVADTPASTTADEPGFESGCASQNAATARDL